MIDPTAPKFELAREARRAGTERALIRRERAGTLTRIRTGVYLPTAEWDAMGVDARYRTLVFATATAVRPGTQFSFDSAAALWRLPSLGAWSPHVHVLGPAASGGRSSPGVRRHAMPLDPHPAMVNDVTVTSLGRTVVAVACAATFARAVCMVDNALRPPEQGESRFTASVRTPTMSELLEIVSALGSFPGVARATLAIRFGVTNSGSIGESLSRAQIHLLGFPPPLLQVPFYDAEGFIGYVDFYWPEFGLIGEFDGRVKYGDSQYARGQLPEEVVWAEKLREDRLRACVTEFARWDWSVARNAPRLERRLRDHGLVPTREALSDRRGAVG